MRALLNTSVTHLSACSSPIEISLFSFPSHTAIAEAVASSIASGSGADRFTPTTGASEGAQEGLGTVEGARDGLGTAAFGGLGTTAASGGGALQAPGEAQTLITPEPGVSGGCSGKGAVGAAA